MFCILSYSTYPYALANLDRVNGLHDHHNSSREGFSDGIYCQLPFHVHLHLNGGINMESGMAVVYALTPRRHLRDGNIYRHTYSSNIINGINNRTTAQS